MTREDWCYVSGYAAALETRLLRMDFFQRMLGSESREDILLLLGETDLARLFESPESLDEAERRIDSFMKQRLMDVRGLCPAPVLVDIFFLAIDFVNFKAVGKDLLLGLDEPFSPAGLVPRSTFEEAWGGEDAEETFWKALADKAKALIEETENKAFGIDLVVDGEHIKHVLARVAELESDGILHYAESWRQARTAQVVYRALAAGASRDELRTLFAQGMDGAVAALLESAEKDLAGVLHLIVPHEVLDGMEATSALALEKALDAFLISSARLGKLVSYGPEPVFGYLCGFMAEVKNLKLTVGGLVDELPPERIESRLRPLYV